MVGLAGVAGGHARLAGARFPALTAAAGDVALGQLAVPRIGLAQTNYLGRDARALPQRVPRPAVAAAVAAVRGTFGELLFPALLVPGLLSRVGAPGLSLVNVLAVVSCWHVLGAEGFAAALAQHVPWGFMLAVVAIFGGGAISLDRLYSAPTSKRASVDGSSAAGRTT